MTSAYLTNIVNHNTMAANTNAEPRGFEFEPLKPGCLAGVNELTTEVVRVESLPESCHNLDMVFFDKVCSALHQPHI